MNRRNFCFRIFKMRWIRRAFATQIPFGRVIENTKEKNRVLRELYLEDLKEVLRSTKDRITLPEGNDYVERILGERIVNQADSGLEIPRFFEDEIKIKNLDHYSSDKICEVLRKQGMANHELRTKSFFALFEHADMKKDYEFSFRLLSIMKEFPQLSNPENISSMAKKLYMNCLKHGITSVFQDVEEYQKASGFPFDFDNTELVKGIRFHLRKHDFPTFLNYLENSELYRLDHNLLVCLYEYLITSAKTSFSLISNDLILLEEFTLRNKIHLGLKTSYKKAVALVVSGQLEEAIEFHKNFPNYKKRSLLSEIQFFMELIKKAEDLGNTALIRETGMRMLRQQILGDMLTVEIVLRNFLAIDPSSSENETWHRRGYDLFENFIRSKEYNPKGRNSDFHCSSSVYTNSYIYLVMIAAYLRDNELTTAFDLIHEFKNDLKNAKSKDIYEKRMESLESIIQSQPPETQAQIYGILK
jgi:hypothetical protein